ncbi:MAG: SurA N-terminal domain-containing protein [Acidobacteria bacterium]|nr:SurA N-terminal domain-containing protein [Acidobacteriota bacterium]
MLKVFRDNLKYLSWVLWLVILVFVLFIFVDFGGIDLAGGPAATGAAAAVVGGREVSYSDFESAYRRAEDQYRQAYGQQFSRDLANQLGLPFQVLNQLVDEQILLREAERIGFEVSDEELRQSIVELQVFQQDGVFIGQQEYTARLRRNGLHPEDFEASQREALLTQKVQRALAQNTYVAPEEVEAAYREEAETATVRLLRLPMSRFAADVTVEESALAVFFDQHQADFRLPERRVVDYLLVDPSELRETVEIADEAVRAFYDEHQEDYASEEQVKARHILLRTGEERSVEQAREEIESIRARLDDGEDFAMLATELSDDPGSKTKGGDLGFFARGAMVKLFEDAAFGAELGDVVGPVETSFGVHLIQVQARRPGGLQPFAEVEDAIRARRVNDGAAAAAATKAAALAQQVTSGLTTEGLRTLAGSELGTTAITTEPFSRGDNVFGIGRATEFTTQAFELAAGGVSEPVQVARGWAVLILREIQEPRLPELDEVRSRVTTEFRQQRQLELATQRLHAAHAAIIDGQSPDDVAAELEVTLESAGPFGAKGSVGSLGQAPEIALQALSMDEGAVSEPFVRETEVVLFEVTDRTRFDNAAFVAEQDAVREGLESQRLRELLRTFIGQRRDELGVTIDPRVFEAFGQTLQNAS